MQHFSLIKASNSHPRKEFQRYCSCKSSSCNWLIALNRAAISRSSIARHVRHFRTLSLHRLSSLFISISPLRKEKAGASSAASFPYTPFALQTRATALTKIEGVREKLGRRRRAVTCCLVIFGRGEMSDKTMSMAWRRPDGPVNVWKIVEGKESLADGTTRTVKFSIQEVPDNRQKETIEFMSKNFIVDEPICKSLNCKDDPKMIHDFHILWNYCLEQGIVEAAYVIDANGQISELAGLNMLCVMVKDMDEEMHKLKVQYQSPKFSKLLDLMINASKRADACSILGVDKYISACGLAVAPHWRGQKLGLRLLEARSEIGQKYEIPATSTIFTARVSQVLAERAGFEEKLSVNYEEVLDEEGNPFFKNIESKNMKVMMKTLY